MSSRRILTMLGFLLTLSSAAHAAELITPPLRAESSGLNFECSIVWFPIVPTRAPAQDIVTFELRNAQGTPVAEVAEQTVLAGQVAFLRVNPESVAPALAPEAQPAYCAFRTERSLSAAQYFAAGAVYQGGVGYTIIVPAQPLMLE